MTKKSNNQSNEQHEIFDMNNSISNFDWNSYHSTSEKKPPLHFILDGKPATIYGGSCHHPMIKDADIYLSLDIEQPVYFWEQPWNTNVGKQHIRFPITDMFIPSNSSEFQACILYIKECIHKGKKVHVGCIGGHGRTGMVLSAIIQESMKELLIDKSGNLISAIDYVRENYALKSVETVPQLLFLHYNFDIPFPKNSTQEVTQFLAFFEKKIGVSLHNIMKKGTLFDELYNVLQEIDNLMYAQNSNQLVDSHIIKHHKIK